MAIDVQTRLIALIADVLEVSADDVRPQSHFFNDLGASSLDIAEVVWRIEDDKDFGIGEIPDEVLENVRCVQDVIDFIDGRQRNIAGPTRSAVPPERARVALGADHAGFGMKEMLREHLEKLGIRTRNVGPTDDQKVDYPEPAQAVAQMVSRGEVDQGILICGTGIGMSIAANKVAGVRAAHVQDPTSTRLTRQHNDANVLCLGSRIIGDHIARECVDIFLNTDFTPGKDGRHRRRVNRIIEIERKNHPSSGRTEGA
jgi:ribose 5-phosphate isomerase B